MEVNIVSSVVSKPASVLRLPVTHGKGIDTMKDLLQFGLSLGVVQKAGAWYSVSETALGCGIDESVKTLEENQELASCLLDLVMERA